MGGNGVRLWTLASISRPARGTRTDTKIQSLTPCVFYKLLSYLGEHGYKWARERKLDMLGKHACPPRPRSGGNAEEPPTGCVCAIPN
jgi:hypothetical protein